MQTVLLVEDDAVIQENLAAILDDEGYDVVCADDGVQALHILKTKPEPHILLLDLMMPKMNGWQMRAVMLENPSWCKIPCIIVSGTNDLRRHADALKAQDYIAKPINLDKLLQAIKACL
jgi:CheY-like chemotaxis protein